MEWQLRKKTPTENRQGEKRDRYSLLIGLFSVLVALLAWFYVQEAEAPDYKKTFTSVNVEMQSLSSSFSVIEGGDQTVDITLVGKRGDLNKIKSSDLLAYMDLGGINQAGSYETEVNVMVPEGAELFSTFPQKATLFVDQTLSVTVPVKVEMGAFTAEDNIGIEPVPALNQISVKGPKSVLDQIDHAKIVTGDLGKISASFESNLDYQLYDSHQRPIESRFIVLPERNVRVKFTVYKTKTVPLTVKSENGWWNEKNMKATVTPESIIIKGEPALVDAVTEIPAVIVNEKSVDSTRYTATIAPSQLPLPEGISLGETLGDVDVKIQLLDHGARTLKMNLTSSHVVVTPPAGEMTYAFLAPSLSFKIRGSYNTIYQAQADDFYFNIDLSGIQTAGEFEVPVEIIQTSKSEGKYYPVGEYIVKVQVN